MGGEDLGLMGCLSLELIQSWDPRSGSHWATLAAGRWIPLKNSGSGYAPVRASGLLFMSSWSSSLSSPLTLCSMSQAGSHCLWCPGSASLTGGLLAWPQHVSHPRLLSSCLLPSHSPCSAPLGSQWGVIPLLRTVSWAAVAVPALPSPATLAHFSAGVGV